MLFNMMVLGCLIFINSSLLCSDNFNLCLNVCQFRFNQDTSLVEVYYGLACQQDSLDQNIKSNPSFLMSLTILEKDKIVVKNIWQLEDQAKDDTEQGNQHMMVDVLKYLLAPGKYDFKLVARHLLQSDIIDSTEIKNVEIRAISPKLIGMSSIELAQKITPEKPENRDKFHKNRYRVIPNPLNIYGSDNNQVYYYLELYNLTKEIKTDFFLLKRTIVDNNGLPLPSVPIYNKKKRIRGDDAIEVGTIDISILPSGRYYLNFSTLDTTGKEYVSSETAFYVYNPDIALPDHTTLPIEQQMASSEIALLSSEDLEVLVGVTNYFAFEEEKNVLSNLTTEDAKKLFLYRYWRDHDNDKSTPILESFREIMKRIQYSNENFKQMKIPGWKTDRGRVLILYGRPSLIQYYTNVPAFKEFQAWSYDHIEQGVVFIFGVLGSFGDLKLIHSTKTGEKYNEGWFDLIKITSGTTGIMDDMNAGINRRESLREIFQRHNLELPRYLK